MTYSGHYADGLREGPWRVTRGDGTPAWEVTWQAGEWHGPTVTWWRNGQVEEEGTHRHGCRAGQWSFWFEGGQLAARGSYADDRKTGPWAYFGEDGAPMEYDDWAAEFDHWDWAYDDYTGSPRGENWPEPPPGAAPRG